MTFRPGRYINKYQNINSPRGEFLSPEESMKFNPIKFFKKIPVFFSEVRKEMKKVSWPTKKETMNKTLIVLAISITLAVFLGGLDALFTFIVRTVLMKQ